MVAPLVPRLGHVRPVCYARPILLQASEALQAGNTLAAGVKLLEAARRYVAALCEAHCVKPARSTRRTVRLLLEAKQLTESGAEWLTDIIRYSQLCADCKFVRPTLIECSITFLWMLLDDSPEIEQPSRNGGAL